MTIAGMETDFKTVRRIPKSRWYAPHYLQRAKTGDILLLGEFEEKTGGFIKIREMSVFLSLTPKHIWEKKPIPWPRPIDGITEFILDGDKAVFR